MKTVTYTVVFRESSETPQQETVRYTPQSANRLATDIIMNGGVAIVVEGEEDEPDVDY